MGNFPKISIVTPSFNQGRFIEKTILSVLEQNYPNLEYIIIDGGSTDESVEIIKKYEKHLEYWISEPDRGQSHAINKGFEQARGDIYCWLNSDDWYYPGALMAVAETFTLNSDAGVLVGAGDMVNEDGDTLLHVSRTEIKLAMLFNWCENYFWQPSCFIKKSAWIDCGPLDETCHYAMDLDLWIRIAKKYKFLTFGFNVSASLSHAQAKTTEFVSESMLDAVKVISKYDQDAAFRLTHQYLNKLVTEKQQVVNYSNELYNIVNNIGNPHEKLIAEIARLENLVTQLQSDINTMYNSVCWRVTKPMRSVFEWFKKVL